MSANNWTKCPKCCAKFTKNAIDRIAEAHASYGKVSAKKYLEMVESSKQASGSLADDTLREDWDLGMESNGKFVVSYSCSCDVCGFEFSHQHEEVVVHE